MNKSFEVFEKFAPKKKKPQQWSEKELSLKERDTKRKHKNRNRTLPEEQ